MSKLQEFINYLYEQVNNHSIYIWGGQGQKWGKEITESWIRAMESSNSYADRAVAYWKKQVASGFGDKLSAFDCSGLSVYWLVKNGIGLQYMDNNDINADGLMRLSDKTDKPQKGDFVFQTYSNGVAHHIGYVVTDDLMVIESKGRDFGVCLTDDLKRNNGHWTTWRRPTKLFPELKQITSIPIITQNPFTLSRILKYNALIKMRGEDVRNVQKSLLSKGCDPNGIDGVFGKGTRDAVIKFQLKAGFSKLDQDGIVGKQTVTKLGGTWTGK